jgi:hypothetical protein
MTETIKPDLRGEHEGNRKTIARGMPGVSGVTVVTTLVCFFILHTRLRARSAPGIPCALFMGRKFLAGLGRITPRDREGASSWLFAIGLETRSAYFPYPPLEGEGRIVSSVARCETGWGGSQSKDFHPTPPLRGDPESELCSPLTPRGEGVAEPFQSDLRCRVWSGKMAPDAARTAHELQGLGAAPGES